MVLLALVPPLWHRVMNPRVLAHYGGDLSTLLIYIDGDYALGQS
ncbi:alkane-1 monooxygenase [Micromonospora sp. B006]|nr:alkane-1 monooxygenase [Micromonospora sp. B006]